MVEGSGGKGRGYLMLVVTTVSTVYVSLLLCGYALTKSLQHAR